MAELVRYHTDHGARAALLVKRGPKHLHVVWIEDNGVKVHRVPVTEERYMRPLDGRIPKARRLMLSAGRRLGITKEARAGLR